MPRIVSNSINLVSVNGNAPTSVKSVKGGTRKMNLIKGVNNAAWEIGTTAGQAETTSLEIEVGAADSPWAIDMMNQVVNFNYQPVDIQVLSADSRRDITRGFDAIQCVLEEFSIAAFDSEGKDQCTISLKFKPEATAMIKRGGKLDAGATNAGQRDFLNSNFEIVMDPFDLTHATKIDKMTWKIPNKPVRVGAKLGHTVHTTRLEFGGLKITCAVTDDDNYGKASDIYEEIMLGKIQRFSAGFQAFGPDNTTRLFGWEAQEVMLHNLKAADPAHGKEEVPTFDMECALETIKFASLG